MRLDKAAVINTFLEPTGLYDITVESQLSVLPYSVQKYGSTVVEISATVSVPEKLYVRLICHLTKEGLAPTILGCRGDDD